MARFDVFSTYNPRTVEHRNHSATSSADATYDVKGFRALLTSPPTLPWAENEIVLMLGGGKGAFCRIARVTSQTDLMLLPIQSESDPAGLDGHVFPAGSSLASNVFTPRTAATLVIDLSEAPEDSYDFAIAALATIGHSANGAVAGASLRSEAKLLDPLSGVDSVGAANMTFASASDQYTLHASRRVTLAGGQRYEFHLQITGSTANQSAKVLGAAMIALRAPGIRGDAAANGKSSEQTNATNSFATAATLGPNIPAGKYLVLATWAWGMSTLAAEFEAQLEIDGSTNVATQNSVPASTSDSPSAGCFGLVDVPATNEVRLRFRRSSAGTAKIANVQLCAVPVPSWVDGTEQSNDLTVHTGPATLPTAFQVPSSPVTLKAGWHIEIASMGIGATEAFVGAGATFAGGGLGAGGTNLPLPAAAGRHVPTFRFVRAERPPGSTTNAAYLLGTVTTARIANPCFAWLREHPSPAPKENDTVAVVAEIEHGGLLCKVWNGTAISNRKVKHFPDARFMSRVLVDGTAYARAVGTIAESDLISNASALVDGQWYWRPQSQDLYVQFAGGLLPSSPDVQVIVLPLLLLSGETIDLIDDDGEHLPYEPRLKGFPAPRQRLEANNGSFNVSNQYGEASIASADGGLNDSLVQHYFPGVRAKIRRGWPEISKRRADFEVIGDAYIDNPGTDFKEIDLELFDWGVNLDKPVSKTRVTVHEGSAAQSNARTRADQLIPDVWGEALGLVAYRTTNDYDALDYNEYRFAGHGVASVLKVYRDPERMHEIPGARLDASSTYLDAGKIRIQNHTDTGQPAADQPFDVVYVDIIGRTSNGLSSGTPLTARGAQARDLLTSYGALPATRLLEPTFRLLDRKHRTRRQGPPYATIVPAPPRLGFVTQGEETIRAAFRRMLDDARAFPLMNRQGRVGVGVPDFQAEDLVTDGSFEGGSTSACWPWFTSGTATLGTTTARPYIGARSAEIGSSSGTDFVGQELVTHKDGWHVVTLMAAVVSGDAAHFRIGIVRPDGVEVLSDLFRLSSQRRKRCTFATEFPEGATGRLLLKLYPANGVSTATVIDVDDVVLMPVAAVADETNSNARALEHRPDVFYAALIAVAVNLASTGQTRKLRLTDGEIRGLGAAVSEGRFTAQSSREVDFGLALVADLESAAGILGAGLSFFGRARHFLTIAIEHLTRVPLVCDMVYGRNLVEQEIGPGGDHLVRKHIPDVVDAYPLWKAMRVGFAGRSGSVLEFEVDRQQDPVFDRVEVGPDAIPLNAGVWDPTTDAMTDFAAATQMEGFYARGRKKPDLVTVRGSGFHQHDLDHDQEIPEHEHETTITDHEEASAGDPSSQWAVGADDYPAYPPPFGPSQQFIAAGDDHGHVEPGTSKKVGAGGGISGRVPGLLSKPGSNDPKTLWARYMLRTANSGGTGITERTHIGWLTPTPPAGWVRASIFDDCAIRGATSLGAVATTIATSSFVPSDTGSILKVASATNVSIDKRLVLTDGGDHMSVKVTALAGTDATAIPLYEVGDTIKTYPVGSPVTGGSEQAGQTFTPTAHDHGGTIPAHEHDGAHSHDEHATEAHELGTASPVDRSINVQPAPVGQPRVVGEHPHEVKPTAPAVAVASGSAGGTLAGATIPAPDSFALVIIKPADPMNLPKSVPAGGVLWTPQESDHPGYLELTEARGKIIKGAPAGQGAGAVVGGHGHLMLPAAHSLLHDHGGSGEVFSEDAGGALGAPDFSNGDPNVSASAGPEGGVADRKGHAHRTHYSISSVDPGLAAGDARPTGVVAGLPSLPRHKAVKLIVKQ